MNKQIFVMAISVILGLVSTQSFANGFRTDVDTWTTSGSVMFDPSTFGGAEYSFELALGKYIDTGVMYGGKVDFLYNDIITSVVGGAICKYHFFDDEETSAVSPYFGGFVGLAYSDVYTGNATALVLGAKLGFDLFVTENISVDTSVGAYYATDDVYTDKDGLTNMDVVVRIGLALFF